MWGVGDCRYISLKRLFAVEKHRGVWSFRALKGDQEGRSSRGKMAKCGLEKGSFFETPWFSQVQGNMKSQMLNPVLLLL